jgi:hypothetical protein
MFKYGIKLPRKRKKAFIKKHGMVNYVTAGIINEILFAESGHPRYKKFPETVMRKGRPRTIFYW